MKLRDYQKKLSIEAYHILQKNNLVYLAMQVRTGKTLTSLEVARLQGAKDVLFLTKKKAIKSIENDYNNFGFTFNLTVINDESLHKVKGQFDLIIHDENHRFGSFPKPSKGAKLFKSRFSHLPQIYLSGTPTPESFSQIYHQLWVSDYSLFKQWTNFYQWAKDFVRVKQVNLGYAKVNDYSDANEDKINKYIDKIFVRYTQKQAGFTSSIAEKFLYVEMKPITYKLISQLKKDKVIQGKDEVILADTGVKELQKVHQMSSGTVKFESGNTAILDNSKALFIRDYFKDKKIGIFYKFVAEFKMLKEVLGENLTDNVEDFDTSDKNIALQIVSGREGVSLKSADCLVYINIDFSATSYWQSRDRMTTKERLINTVYWIFAKNGIEDKIYKAVKNKKNFTLKHYDRTTISI